MSTFESMLLYTDKVVRIMLIMLMSFLILDVLWQVISRLLISNPSSFTEEVARFLLIWISLLGAAYTYRLNSHLGFDLFVNNLTQKNTIRIHRLCCLLVFIFAVLVLLVGGINLVNMTWVLEQRSPVLNIPMAYVYSIIPLSGLLFLLYSAWFFFNIPNNLGLQGSK